MATVHLASLVVAGIACAFDLRTRRIPNVLTFGAACCALVYHLTTAGLGAGGYSLGGWFVGLLIFFLPFALGGMGGGDVKLLAALGAWVGPRDVVWVALYTGVAGAVMALGVSVWRGYLRCALSNVWLLLCHWRVAGLKALPEITLDGSSAPKLAYALPILVGVVTTIWLR